MKLFILYYVNYLSHLRETNGSTSLLVVGTEWAICGFTPSSRVAINLIWQDINMRLYRYCTKLTYYIVISILMFTLILFWLDWFIGVLLLSNADYNTRVRVLFPVGEVFIINIWPIGRILSVLYALLVYFQPPVHVHYLLENTPNTIWQKLQSLKQIYIYEYVIILMRTKNSQ